MKFLTALKAFWPKIKGPVFNFYVAIDMLICAVVLFPWAKPRETISGFIGRHIAQENRVALWLGLAIDWLLRDPGHCGETAMAEAYAYDELYPEQPRDEKFEG